MRAPDRMPPLDDDDRAGVAGAASALAPGLCVVYSRDEDSKHATLAGARRLLFGFRKSGPPPEGSPAWESFHSPLSRIPPSRRTPAIGAPDLQALLAGGIQGEVFVLSLEEPAATPGEPSGGVVERLLALSNATKLGAPGAVLPDRARTLLCDGPERGKINRLVDELDSLQSQILEARREEEALAAAAAGACPGSREVVRLREQLADLGRERERIAALMRALPVHELLRDLRRTLDALPPHVGLSAEAVRRARSLQDRRSAAGAAARALRQRRDRVARECAAVQPDEAVLAVAKRIHRFDEQIPAYRNHLMALAGTRARLQDEERRLAILLGELDPALQESQLDDLDPDALDPVTLAAWTRRAAEVSAAQRAAEEGLQSARSRVGSLCAEVARQLGEEPPPTETGLDAAWRALWRLRSHLDDLWIVQSGGEATARAVQEGERELQEIDILQAWALPLRLRSALGLLLVASIFLVVTFGVLGRVFAATLAGVGAIALLALDFALGWHRQTATSTSQRLTARREQLRREVEKARLERDVSWLRAAELQAQVTECSDLLGLPSSPSLEAVELREQELAAEIAASDDGGGGFAGMMRELLASQDEEKRREADLERARDKAAALGREWTAWRAERGLPDGVSPARAAAWLEQVRRTREALAATRALREELQRIEPKLAVWEGSARFALAKIGAATGGDLCGNRLVDVLRAARAQVAEHERRRAQHAELKTQLAGIERGLDDAEAESSRFAAELRDVMTEAGLAGEDDLERSRGFWEQRQTVEAEIERERQALGAALAGHGDPEAARRALEEEDGAAWNGALEAVEARTSEVEAALRTALDGEDARTRRWQALGDSNRVPSLTARAAAIRDELDAAAREWRVIVLAHGLIEETCSEVARIRGKAVLREASRTFRALSEGRYVSLVAEHPGQTLVLIDASGRRVRLNGQLDAATIRSLELSLRLGVVREAATRTPLVLVVDDILPAFEEAQAHVVAEELEELGHRHPVLYFTSDPGSRQRLARLTGAVRVVDSGI